MTIIIEYRRFDKKSQGEGESEVQNEAMQQILWEGLLSIWSSVPIHSRK